MDKIRDSKRYKEDNNKYRDEEQMEDRNKTPYFKRDFVQREMFDAVCDECHNACKVPFKPAEGRPIFCRDCFQKRKGF